MRSATAAWCLAACAALPAAAEEHWAFLPFHAPPLPAVRNDGWAESPLDLFILSGLEARGLAPAPPADKRTLCRRASFDLLGLPPDAEDVDAFLADDSPDAFARLVERMLASPRYGERWGRHWLDVARYADSNGMDENLAYGTAFRYRDYVIRSFNRDLPLDLFIQQQVAGDLLPAGGDADLDLDRTIATGFLALGPKMLAEDDPQKMEMDIVDEQVDAVGRAFMGLTLGCARCHDHKFDPITLEDYYSLAGIFKSTRTMENFKVVARWQELPIASREEIERRDGILAAAAAGKSALEREIGSADRGLVEAARKLRARYAGAGLELARHRALLAALKPAAESPGRDPGGSQTIWVEAESYARGNTVKDFTVYGNPIGVIYNAGELPNYSEYPIERERSGPCQLDLRYAAAEARPVSISINGRLAKENAAGAATGGWSPENQRWETQGVYSLEAGKNVIRLERAGPFPHFDKLAVTPLEPAAGREPIRTADELAAQSGLLPGFLRQWAEFLEKRPAGLRGSIPDAAEIDRAAEDPRGPFAIPADASAYYEPEVRKRVDSLRGEIQALEASAPALPQAMAVSEGKAADLRVHLRGSYLTLGREAARRFPAALAGENQARIGADRSGRLELAQWLTRPDHPLTSRAMANRIWRWHFGAGIARTVDNLGKLGEAPANPPLLDWLARRLIDSGWSLKEMHRTILLSSAYRMSSTYQSAAAEADPDNRLLWRFPRRRLEAEVIHDSILFAGGGLDLTMGGTLLATRDREYVAGTASTNSTAYGSPRRSVYLPVIRSALNEMLQAFDFADPSALNGDRDCTTVAPQALFLMNSGLIESETRRLAAGLAPGAEASEFIRLAYRRLFQRPPAAPELADAAEFLTAYARELPADTPPAERALKPRQALLRALFYASEFIHAD